MDSEVEPQTYEIIFNLDISLKMKSLGYFLVDFIYLPKSVYPGHQGSMWKKIGQNLSAQDKEEGSPLMKVGYQSAQSGLTMGCHSRKAFHWRLA